VSPADARLREAVRRLHWVKNAAYRDAWKRRGEVISILANIARKVDRLEYGLDGASTAGGESLLDTACDLLVYCLKYQAYLADVDADAASLLFGGTDIGPPYSDGLAGFESLLARLVDEAPQPSGLLIAAAQVLSRFGTLEACFRGVSVVAPPAERLARALALTGAALSLITAIRDSSPDLYATYIPACMEDCADA
jgi:hypothetical protein